MFRKQKIKPYDRQAVLGILPFELKAKILRHLYAGAIRDVPLLRKLSDDDLFMTDMCIRLQPYNCSANTFVYQRGEHGHSRRARPVSRSVISAGSAQELADELHKTLLLYQY